MTVEEESVVPAIIRYNYLIPERGEFVLQSKPNAIR